MRSQFSIRRRDNHALGVTLGRYSICSSSSELAICVHNWQNLVPELQKWYTNEVILTGQCFCLFFWRKLFKYTERNNHLKLLFHDRMFCHARSRENMARPVNLHGRPLDRCAIFGSVPQRNARIMNPKNPDLDLI